MIHIQETPSVFPYLYYQRIFVKGYIVFSMPAIIAVTSDIAKGYVYLRRRTRGVRIRDLNNTFLRGAFDGQPIGLRQNPLRDIGNAISADVRAMGRDDPLTWVYTRDDLPRIINDETFTEFLACVPVRDSKASPVGNFNLVSTYFDEFVDWYRLVTGDLSITGSQHWNSHIPMQSECIVDIRNSGVRAIDEIVLEVEPSNFGPRIFNVDLEPNEKGSVNPVFGQATHERRIANYLARGTKVPLVHRRFADILHLAQETKDWGLVALSMYPVFEQYLDSYMDEACSRSSSFKAFVSKERGARKIVYVGERIKWIPQSLTNLGFDADSAKPYYEELSQANEERVRVVHYSKQPTFEESMNLARIITNAVFLLETALGQETAYAVPLMKRDAKSG